MERGRKGLGEKGESKKDLERKEREDEDDEERKIKKEQWVFTGKKIFVIFKKKRKK